MKFNNYKIIPNYQTGKITLNLPELADIKNCETRLNVRFEKDYKDYITRFGQGVFGGSFIRIFTPNTIVANINEWKNRIDEYWFWDAGKDILTKEQALASIIIGNTLGGDDILFYKKNYYILPRNDEKIFKVGNSLSETIEWLCSSGILTEPFKKRDFEPYFE